MKVSVDIQEDEVDGENGYRSGIRITCEKCGYEVEVYGTTVASARYGAVKLSDECPLGEQNFYDVDWWAG